MMIVQIISGGPCFRPCVYTALVSFLGVQYKIILEHSFEWPDAIYFKSYRSILTNISENKCKWGPSGFLKTDGL